MKASRLFTATALSLVLAAAAHAQDLQYRMTNRMTMPSMPMAMPAVTMEFAVKGTLLRVDTDVPMPGSESVMRTTAIIDMAGKKFTVLDHSAKTYTEMTPPSWRVSAADSARAKFLADSARKAMNFNPVTKATGETRKIGEFTARRIVMSMDFTNFAGSKGGPFGDIKEGNKLIVVSEQWVTDDSKLAHAREGMMRMLNRGNNPAGMMMDNDAVKGFPLEGNMLMVQLPKNAAFDPEALLQAGEKAEGLVMSATMTIDNIKTALLDASLFTAPKDYTKQ